MWVSQSERWNRWEGVVDQRVRKILNSKREAEKVFEVRGDVSCGRNCEYDEFGTS